MSGKIKSSDPDIRAILDLDGGRFGKALLGLLYMVAQQHSEEDTDGPDHYRIQVQGHKELRRFFLSFQELTVRQVSVSLLFTLKLTPKPHASSAPQSLPQAREKDTLPASETVRETVRYVADEDAGKHPHPPHARGRALRTTA